MNVEEKKAFFNTRFSLMGNIHYTRALFTAQANKEELKKNPNAPKKFSTVLSWNPQDPRNAQALQAMNAFMAEAKRLFNPTVPDQYFVWPVKKWETYQRQDGKQGAPFLQGKHWLNLSSGEKFKPKVVDQNKIDIIDESTVFSGINAIVSFSFYDMGAGNSTSKKGLGVNIVAVMVLGGGVPDPIGEFNVNLDEVFGQFANMSAPMGQGYGQAPAAPAPQPQYAPPMAQPAYEQQYQAPPQQPVQAPAYAPSYPAQPNAQPFPAQQPMQQPQYQPAPQGYPGQAPAPQGQPGPNGWQY